MVFLLVAVAVSAGCFIVEDYDDVSLQCPKGFRQCSVNCLSGCTASDGLQSPDGCEIQCVVGCDTKCNKRKKRDTQDMLEQSSRTIVKRRHGRLYVDEPGKVSAERIEILNAGDQEDTENAFRCC